MSTEHFQVWPENQEEKKFRKLQGKLLTPGLCAVSLLKDNNIFFLIITSKLNV